MAFLEESRATWEKRYSQRHYNYRDYHEGATGLAPATYVFGTNARAISVNNWPALGDWATAMTCYAREVTVHCDQDVFVRIISVNPEYLEQAVLQATIGTVPTAPQFITEVEQVAPMGAFITFYPTYGVSILFRRVTVSGTVRIWIEGNVEGTD